MSTPQHYLFWQRLRPEIAVAWSLIGHALDTRTAHRARQHAATWRAATSLPEVAELLVEVAEAHWHPALTFPAVHLQDALHAADRNDGPTSARLARQATREILLHWGELKTEGDLRRVGAQLGSVLDGYLVTTPAPMLAQAWTELPLIDAFTATFTAFTSNQPRTWTHGQVVAVIVAWDQLLASMPLPEPSQPYLDGARRVAQIQHSLDVARMLLSAYPTSPPPLGGQDANLPTLHATPRPEASTRPAPTNPASRLAAAATPAGAFDAVCAAGALLSQLVGPSVVCEKGNQLIDHWTIDTPVTNAWNCLRRAAHTQPPPRVPGTVWSAVRGMTLPDAPMAAAVERYERLDWRGACYYAQLVIGRAQRHATTPEHQTGKDLPATAVEDGPAATDTTGPEPRAGPDLA